MGIGMTSDRDREKGVPPKHRDVFGGTPNL